MDYLDNDFLIPVILGDGKDSSKAAKFVRDVTKIRPFIFSSEFSLLQRISFKCRKLPLSNRLYAEHLCNFAYKISTQYSLLLIYCESYRAFIENNSLDLESRYIAVSFEEILNNYKENNR